MKNKQRLELTWIGKDEQSKLEPRILLEDPDKSYGDVNSENMLIYGDNLLALKALEQDFSGKIKCIYIDPPFNTGTAFEHYNDSLEHSIWLSMMSDRFKLLYNLLSEDGIVAVHLDDTEMAYCKAILDEIFGRVNYFNTIAMKTLDPSGFKATGNKIFSTTNYILVFAKSRINTIINPVYIEKDYDIQYSQYIINRNEKYTEWKWKPIKEYLALEKFKFSSVREAQTNIGKEEFKKQIAEFAISNADSVFRKGVITGGAYLKRKETILFSKRERGKILVHPNEDIEDFYILDGDMILFYNKRLVNIYDKKVPGELITDFWTDISWNGIANEGGVTFKNGKKPEALIERVLNLFTNEGDWVIDSFLGSGTTSAVAHKMNRKWIGIELLEHCHTHCLPRQKKVVDGSDQTGISRIVNWQGGGGFKYYELAPSLLKKDKYDNWIIDEQYNADTLAAAMAKHEGFKYHPDESVFWKQGQSTENDYIFTTTNFITVEYLDKIHDEMKPEESLLICCKSFQKACNSHYLNITVKKIPNMLLGRCEFGKDDYSLNIITMPVDPDAPDFEPIGLKEKNKKKKNDVSKKQLDL